MNNEFETDGVEDLEMLLTELEDGDFELAELPAGLWEDIEAEALAEVPSVPEGVRLADRNADSPEMFVYDADAVAAQTDSNTRSSTDSNVVSIDSKRFSARAMPALAIAAAAVVVAGMVGIVLSRSSDQSDILASAELAYDDSFDPLGADADATIVLVNDGGESLIKIDQSTLPDTASEAADLELWLIEPDADGGVADLVSLGLIDRDDPGSFEIPAGYDADTYFVVDISIEPRDGVETHSGRSILRGPLSDA